MERFLRHVPGPRLMHTYETNRRIREANELQKDHAVAPTPIGRTQTSHRPGDSWKTISHGAEKRLSVPYSAAWCEQVIAEVCAHMAHHRLRNAHALPLVTAASPGHALTCHMDPDAFRLPMLRTSCAPRARTHSVKNGLHTAEQSVLVSLPAQHSLSVATTRIATSPLPLSTSSANC